MNRQQKVIHYVHCITYMYIRIYGNVRIAQKVFVTCKRGEQLTNFVLNLIRTVEYMQTKSLKSNC